MSLIPYEIRRLLFNSLDIYNEDKFEYKRKAYNDDNVLILKGVSLSDIIIKFNLYNKDFYKNMLNIINNKNNKEEITNLKNNKKIYKIHNLKYYLSEYDFGSEKYNRLYLSEVIEKYKYDNNIKDYKLDSIITGGTLYEYNLKYNDLIDEKYNIIPKVVKTIINLENKL